ncbi:Ligand-dependent nuclear receptor-interacting factor 1 Receptor-interacting factor 1 [Larimichthys crocea]|uniref:Ligand-dependent nuclear receptor-interacting factor 1 Receptor-interacting factor 1 n=1 Tax=Larimichthys crocea TaxID=215358 RepID=A0A6G0INZ4_LARCR|nr:Ligand-dependent nuclear receptor-interacting factor 1 Receptor-interacting factor 1 [Larimichthys crocea]
MYPTIREMDAVHSGTGVFYQAMPAVGADGKNIMKLIPVQMVNGQFVPTETSKPKKAPTPQKAVTIDIASAAIQMVKEATWNTSASQLLRKQASLVSQVDLNVRNSANKHPLLQPSVNSITKVPQMATPATNCVSQQVTFPSQLPVTVKSPALPRGQYLQIPPNAQVRTVPASELPPGIKKQIFTSSASSSSGSGVPSVVYVSPITTMDQGCTPPNCPALNLLELLSKKSASTSCVPPPKPQLKLIPQVSQRPNSPIKWIIEEEESSAPQALDALNSSLVTSEILRAVAVREKAHKPCDAMTKPASQLSQSESSQGEESALVMCNGKVFFVAKKSNLPIPVGIDDSPTVATKNTTVPSPALTADIQQIIIPDESDEVIDLCDDDDSSQKAVNTAAVTHLDEDNVIFVSYIPPKSDSGSAQDLILQTPKALTKVTDQRGTSSSNSAQRQKRLHGNAGDDALRRESVQNPLVSAVQNHIHARGPAVINAEGSKVNSQQSTSTQHVGSLEVDVERKSQAYPKMSDGSSGTCSRVEEDTYEMENSVSPAAGLTSLPASESRPMADRLLGQLFGITADVRICLQRIDEASTGSVPAEPLQSESIRSVEDHQEAMSRSKEDKLFLQDFSSPQKHDSSNRLVKQIKVLTEQERPADPATPGPHTHLQCSHLEQTKTLKCNSGQRSLKETPCDVETKPLISYLEPIDEDFLSTDENNPTDALPQTCVNLNTNTRRMGRTRKRTFCPCCITGTHDPATKSEKPEKLTTKQTSKRGGRTKSVRIDMRTSGRKSWLKTKNKQSCQTYEALASERFSTTSMDPEDHKELQRLERIKRLKDLLREKEAALDLMRNNMS